MPFLKVLRTEIIDHSRKLCKIPTTNYELRTHHWRRRRQGFSLIEIVIALFVIVALGMILFSSSGTLFTTRNAKQQNVAAKIASKQIENLKNTPFNSLPTGAVPPASPSPIPCPSTDPDLNNLKGNGVGGHGTCSLFVSNYDNIADSASPPTDIKQITAQIDWKTDKGTSQILKVDSLIYRYGR